MGRMLLETHRHPKNPRITLDLRADSPFYQVRVFVDGRQRSVSTKTSDIRTACRWAESWYAQQLRTTHPVDQLGLDPIVVDVWTAYRDTLTGTRRAEAVKRWGPIKTFWASLRVVEIGPKTFLAFYKWRRRTTNKGRPIKPHTLHKDITVIRQILKHAMAEEQIDRLPMIPSPGRIDPDPPPPLTDVEWDHLCAVSHRRIAEAPNARTRQQRTDCDHFMRLMVASCARVGEIRALRFRDCRYRLPETDTGSPRLVATVTGKRGTRDIVAAADAVEVIHERLGKPEDLVFPEHGRDAFRELLIAAKLRADAKGRVRNAKALRSTAICRALLAGQDVVFVAKNAGTSIAVISVYYTKYLTAEMAVRASHPIEVAATAGRE